MTVHNFPCPGCKQNCQLDDETNGLRHALPTCNVYEKTKGDGQKFLELAFQVRPVPAKT